MMPSGVPDPLFPSQPPRAGVQERTARMSIAVMHGIGMRRFPLTLRPAPVRVRGRPTVEAPVFARVVCPP